MFRFAPRFALKARFRPHARGDRSHRWRRREMLAALGGLLAFVTPASARDLVAEHAFEDVDIAAEAEIADDSNVPPGTREDIIAMASDAMADSYSVASDGQFEIRNYTDEDIKTCFYYADDDIMRIPIAIRDDKDDCITTPAAGKKEYRRDTVVWSDFKRRPGHYHTLEREVNLRVFRRGLAGRYVKTYCKRKGVLQPDQLRIRKQGGDCGVTVVRKTSATNLRNQGISRGRDVLRWADAHSEDISYLVARNDRLVFVAIRGT